MDVERGGDATARRHMEADAFETRLRAERWTGEMMTAQRETVGLATGGQPYQDKSTELPGNPVAPTLNEPALTKTLPTERGSWNGSARLVSGAEPTAERGESYKMHSQICRARGTSMSVVENEGISKEPPAPNRPTTVTKDGDPTFSLGCHTLGEAIIEVHKWAPEDKNRARFDIDGLIYTWDDLDQLGIRE
jgi:hypothetical protein